MATESEASAVVDVSSASASVFGRWRVRLFGMPLSAASARVRGFAAHDAGVTLHLDRVGETFLTGYHAALCERNTDDIRDALHGVEPAWQGFAYEGAAMGCMLRDLIAPWRGWSRWRALDAAAPEHRYMLLVGAGWALARLRWQPAASVRHFDPILGWLVMDGYGFQHGYFHQAPWPAPLARVPRVSGYAARAADQGLGRSLWFIEQADPVRIMTALAAVADDRRADLWSGVGLACTYAGCGGREPYERLLQGAGQDAGSFAQGVAFATEARLRAGHVPAHTREACRVVFGASADEVSTLVRDLSRDLPDAASAPAYEVWRMRLRQAGRTRG